MEIKGISCEVIVKTMLKNLSLMLALLISLCSCVGWVNPISDVEDAKVDKRLIGTWVPDPGNKTFRDVDITMYHIYEIDEHSLYVYMMPPMDPMNPDSACVKGYHTMHVSELEGRTFVNLKGYDCSTQEFSEYLIFEYELNGENEVIFYIIDDGFVREAIRHERLSGNEEGEGVIVSATSQEIRDFIKVSPKEKLFYRDDTLVLKRFEKPKVAKKPICILF